MSVSVSPELRPVGRRAMLRARTTQAWQSPELRQSLLFTGSTVLVTALGLPIKALLAGNMSPTDFGVYSFALSTLTFAALFFEFGLYVPAARLGARSDLATRRELFAAALIVFIPVGALFCLTVVGLSLTVDLWSRVDAGSALLLVAPLAFIYPFRLLGLWTAQGFGRPGAYSLTDALGQVAFLGVVVAVVVAGSLDVEIALLLRSLTLLLGGVLLVLWLRPVFKRAAGHARSIVRGARAYGFEIYVGRLLGMGTYNMDVLMLGALTDARSVGLYALALAFTALITVPMDGIASALFARMARGAGLETRWLAAAWALGLGGAAAATLLAHPVLAWVFSSGYAEASALVLPLALAAAVRGVTTLYNSFLAGAGRGRDLRNTGLVLTASNLTFNFALIPAFGAAGAAWASLFALLINFGAHVVFYRRSLSDLGASSPPTSPAV